MKTELNIDMHSVYIQDPNIVSRNIAGEVILVPIRSNLADMDLIFTLNETAAFIWSLLDGQRQLQAILQQVVEEFKVDSDEAQQDLQELIKGLLDAGAVKKVEV